MMISCKRASQLTSKSLDQRLSFSERWSLRLHLLICNVCRRFKQQLYTLSSAIKGLLKQTEEDETIQLSLEAKARIKTKIESNLE